MATVTRRCPYAKLFREGEEGGGNRLLRKQMAVEGELISLYEKTVSGIESRPVKHLLSMIRLDSMKHVDICQTVMEVLQGEDLLKPEKEEIIQGMQRHIELEKDSIDRANKILKSVWIYETQGLKELIEKLRDDEKRHHEALKKLAGKRFFRLESHDMVMIFKDTEWLEERYKRFEREKPKR